MGPDPQQGRLCGELAKGAFIGTLYFVEPAAHYTMLRGNKSKNSLNTNSTQNGSFCGRAYLKKLLHKHVKFIKVFSQQVIEGQTRFGTIGGHRNAYCFNSGIQITTSQAQFLFQEIVSHRIQLGLIGAGHVPAVCVAQNQFIGFFHARDGSFIDRLLSVFLDIRDMVAHWFLTVVGRASRGDCCMMFLYLLSKYRGDDIMPFILAGSQ
jgi:hypothetical protein